MVLYIDASDRGLGVVPLLACSRRRRVQVPPMKSIHPATFYATMCNKGSHDSEDLDHGAGTSWEACAARKREIPLLPDLAASTLLIAPHPS
jgi:hypothetical protein